MTIEKIILISVFAYLIISIISLFIPKKSKKTETSDFNQYEFETLKDDVETLTNENYTLMDSIDELKERIDSLELQLNEIQSFLSVKDLEDKSMTLKDKVNEINNQQRMSSLNYSYDESGLISYEYYEPITNFHWISIIRNEKNNKIIVKHYRSELSSETLQSGLSKIFSDDEIFNKDNIYGFKDRETLQKFGKIYISRK
jgi:uncharacterized protein YoxC